MATQIKEYPYYCFKETEDRKFYEGRYWNSQGTNVAIVAIVTGDFDWAAYIGADTHSSSERGALNYIADYGDKLSKADAEHFFPDIKLPYRN